MHEILSEIDASQWGTHYLYLVGSLSRLVDRLPSEPSLSKGVLPLIIATNGPNGAILSTRTFNNRILCHFCNRQYFGVQKEKNGDRGTIVHTATLTDRYSYIDLYLVSTKIPLHRLELVTNCLHLLYSILQSLPFFQFIDASTRTILTLFDARVAINTV